MKIVIEYLNGHLQRLESLRSEKEILLNSKIIEANEIHKTVSKLAFNDNDTYNIFNASGSKIEFKNREVVELRKQEEQLKREADVLSDEIREINLELESLAIAIAHANSSESKLSTLSNEVIRLNGEVAMYSTGGKKFKEEKPAPVESAVTTSDEIKEEELASIQIEKIDIEKNSHDFLEEVSNRLFFLSRILKFDPVRVRLEIDEIYKSIIKYINK